MTTQSLWPLVRAERSALADALDELAPDAWGAPSLCDAWTVHDVLAHLTAAARTPTLPWFVNMVRSGFDTDRHNRRLLLRHQGPSAAETLASFRAAVPLMHAPLGAQAGALSEVVVHAQDIARPLGLPLTPSREAIEAVAEFLTSKDFAVNSRTMARGLHLEATDGEFRTGDGPRVTGTTLALALAVAGRPIALEELSGEGVGDLRERLRRT